MASHGLQISRTVKDFVMHHYLDFNGFRSAFFAICGAFVWGAWGVCQGIPSPPEQERLRELLVTDFESLVVFAHQRRNDPFTAIEPPSKSLSELSYEQFREIRFRHQAATWLDGDSPFWLETFHRGFVQKNRVEIFTIESGRVFPVPYRRDDFDFAGKIEPVLVPRDSGHAGLKVVGRFPGRSDPQEMLTFLGASYFRARSGSTVYGTSSRGLAIDIARNREEQFPLFRRLWVSQPAQADASLEILAHLDSPSVSGAYRFQLHPGDAETRVNVQAKVFFRERESDDRKYGIAPLTSMWIWGDGLPGPPQDLRPAVHDSDGLLIESKSEGWIWRPYARLPFPSTSHRRVEKLMGFGMLQRNRAFFHYDDHNAKYHLRPSVWVRPKNPWENGRVELLELPGAHEGIDNLGAYWVPDQIPTDGRPLELEYDLLYFGGDIGTQTYVARATDFHVDRNAVANRIGMTIRFAGPALRQLSETTPVDVVVKLSDGSLLKKEASRTETGDYLVDLDFRPSEKPAVELEVSVQEGGRKLTEIFSYLCPVAKPSFQYPAVYTREDS